MVSLLIIGISNFSSSQEFQGKLFIVSNGSDSNPGTISQSLATIEAARDAARLAGAGKHRIIIIPGNYYLTRAIELDARDNGLTIEAETTGTAILYGGEPVTGWNSDGDRFWYVNLLEVKEGTWDFRAFGCKRTFIIKINYNQERIGW